MADILIGGLGWGVLKLTSSLVMAGWKKITGDDSASEPNKACLEWGGDIVIKAHDRAIRSQTWKPSSNEVSVPSIPLSPPEEVREKLKHPTLTAIRIWLQFDFFCIFFTS